MPHYHVATGSWGVSIPLTLAIVFVAWAYLRGWLRLGPTANRISAWRATSFFAGLLLIWVALASPVAWLDHELLTIHMIQHLLLMTIAPPLIWLGQPVLALTSARSHRLGSTLGPRPQRFADALTQPAFCLFVSSVVLLGWHIPAVFALGMKSESWHVVQQASFLVTGLLFWWPVIQPWPSIRRHELSLILYLFLATLPCDILSGFLVFCDRVVYPAYSSPSHLFGFSALDDQQCAAALMWTCVTIVYLVAGALLTMHFLSPAGPHEASPPPWQNPATQNLIQPRVEALEHGH